MRYLILLLVILLFFCAGNYRKYNGSVGYTDLKVGKDIYEIEFVVKGPSILNAKKKAYVRAAEIGKELGYPFFDVLEINAENYEGTQLIEGKKVINETVSDSNKKKIEITETAPSYNKITSSASKIKVIYSDSAAFNVDEYLHIGKKSGYFKKMWLF